MSEDSDSLAAIGLWLASLLEPLVQWVPIGQFRVLLGELGLSFPSNVESDPALTARCQAAADALHQLPNRVQGLNNAIQNQNVAAILNTSVLLASSIVDIVASLNPIADALRSAGAGAGIPAVELDDFCNQLPTRVLHYAIIRRLENSPLVADALDFTGAIERVRIPAVDTQHPEFVRREIHVDKLLMFLKNPTGALMALYQWGSPVFDGRQLLVKLYDLAWMVGLPAVVDTTSVPPSLDAFFVGITTATGAVPPGLTIEFSRFANLGNAKTVGAGNWQLRPLIDAKLGGGDKLTVEPDGTVTITPAGGTQPSGQIGLEWSWKPGNNTPVTIIGVAGASQLQLSQITAQVRGDFSWNAGAGRAEGRPAISGSVLGGHLVIDLSAADGFISNIVGGSRIGSSFGVELGFSNSQGLFFQGSSGLTIQVPLHVSVGPVDITGLTLSGALQANGVPLTAAVDIRGGLGPLQAVVQQIGFIAALNAPAALNGNLGALDLGFAFKPPAGVGLSVDAGVVTGGGFLSVDTDRGEYSGALQLVFADFLELSAIGFIDTKTPDGSSQFSLLIIITADFGAGIQLGFGFTLNKVGGLLGLNRGIAMQALMDGVRSNAIQSVMFPHDVIANAPKIISDLRTFFPPQPGTFLIGPMAELGWGEPILASLSLGVIIEIPPGDIALLGVLRVALPADQLAILVLQVNFAGAIEPTKQRLYFFASLYDSHVLFITIAGEMGLLFAWGDNANFVLSVGGFHPQFNPPPLPFPAPQRISVDILNESFARIHADGYFAVTTNTVQFGTHADMFFGFSACSVSGHSAFDALIQFSPFHFIVSISTSFSVKVFGIGVYGVGIALQLEGPTPWHAHGTASLSFFFFSINIGIEFTWGDDRNTTLPPVQVMPILSAELAKQSNWKAVFAAGTDALVILRAMSPDESQHVLHPAGTLQISQQAVPLDLLLDKFGNQKPSDANRFAVSVTSPDLTKTRDLQAAFAPAQFKNMDDAAKLSQPAYAPQDSGLELAGAGELYATGIAVCREVRYDETIIDTRLRRVFSKFSRYAGSLFRYGLRGNAAARVAVSAALHAQTHPFDGAVTVAAEAFVIAHIDTNTAYTATAFTSQSSAGDHISRVVAANPALAGTLHVLPQFEVAA